MMVIISDTSVISNLEQVELLQILHKLYKEVYIPPAVAREIATWHPKLLLETPWLRVISPRNIDLISNLELSLDRGESEAISLSLELEADLLLIDEKAGRRKAKELEINITGILGLLLIAKESSLIPLVMPVIEKLKVNTSFYVHDSLYQAIKDQSKE